jgi:hypothetical protein
VFFLLFICYINVSIIFLSHTSRSKLGVRSSHLLEERYSWIQRCLPNRLGEEVVQIGLLFSPRIEPLAIYL